MLFVYGFFVGIIFIIFVYPIITDIYSIIAQGVEYVNTKIAVKTYKLQAELQEDAEGSPAFAMGFQYEGEEEYDDEDDEFWEEEE